MGIEIEFSIGYAYSGDILFRDTGSGRPAELGSGAAAISPLRGELAASPGL